MRRAYGGGLAGCWQASCGLPCPDWGLANVVTNIVHDRCLAMYP